MSDTNTITVEAIRLVCPNCLANTSYSASNVTLTCKHCGYQESLVGEAVGTAAAQTALTADLYKDAQQGWGRADRRDVHCESCLAEFSLPDDSTTTRCPFCGTNKIIPDQQGPDAIRPMYVLPFEKSLEDVEPAVDAWLRDNNWILPEALRKSMQDLTFQAVYLPFWTFDAVVSGMWKGYIGEEMGLEVLGKVVPVPEKHDVRYEFTHPFDDFVVAGSYQVTPELLRWMSDFDFAKLADYDPKLLTGRAAHAYEIQLHDAWHTGQREMRQRIKREIYTKALAHKNPKLNMVKLDISDYADVVWRYLLLPVYIATYSYQGETQQVLVNGQSGAVVAQRPVGWGKAWGRAALWLLPALLLAVCVPFANALIGFPVCTLLWGALLVVGVIGAYRPLNAAWKAARPSKAAADSTSFVRRGLIFVGEPEKMLL